MKEMIKIGIGILVLLLGIIVGNLLARSTKEELKKGQPWFKLILITSLIGGFIGLVIGDDVLLFSLFFIAVITSRSLKRTKN